ncbi:MAG: C-GCAxxG-C-C family protein [Clostridia bacterium]|nr:C-GCAxxG-C-C family protein [Clostridia bacterium]
MTILTDEKLLHKELAKGLADRAEELFRQGYNCCESMIKASIEIFELPLPESTYLMGRFFRQGVAESGCICGALAGGVMMLGFIAGEHKQNVDLAKKFQKDFIRQFGSSCCRVIRKNHSLLDKFSTKECKLITRYTAGKLQEILVRESR